LFHVRSGRQGYTSHHEPPEEWKDPIEPKPPREVDEEEACPTAADGVVDECEKVVEREDEDDEDDDQPCQAKERREDWLDRLSLRVPGGQGRAASPIPPSDFASSGFSGTPGTSTPEPGIAGAAVVSGTQSSPWPPSTW
jgi:hypothetical protein